MKQRVHLLQRPLDRVFSAPSHLAILRSLADNAEGMSGREVARQAGINHQACAKGLARLERIGIVIRQGGRRLFLFRLNRDHILVRETLLPLLKKERQFSMALRDRLGKIFGPPALSVTIFGSVSRGEETETSDLDLCIVVGNPKMKPAVHKIIDQHSQDLFRTYGMAISPLILTREALLERWRRSDALVMNMLKDGKVVSGMPLKEIIHGR